MNNRTQEFKGGGLFQEPLELAYIEGNYQQSQNDWGRAAEYFTIQGIPLLDLAVIEHLIQKKSLSESGSEANEFREKIRNKILKHEDITEFDMNDKKAAREKIFYDNDFLKGIWRQYLLAGVNQEFRESYMQYFMKNMHQGSVPFALSATLAITAALNGYQLTRQGLHGATSYHEFMVEKDRIIIKERVVIDKIFKTDSQEPVFQSDRVKHLLEGSVVHTLSMSIGGDKKQVKKRKLERGEFQLAFKSEAIKKVFSKEIKQENEKSKDIEYLIKQYNNFLKKLEPKSYLPEGLDPIRVQIMAVKSLVKALQIDGSVDKKLNELAEKFASARDSLTGLRRKSVLQFSIFKEADIALSTKQILDKYKITIPRESPRLSI